MRKSIVVLIVFVISVIFVFNIYSQAPAIPNPTLPLPSTPQQPQIPTVGVPSISPYQGNPHNPHNPQDHFNTQQRNTALIEQVRQYEAHQQQIREQNEVNNLIEYAFPSMAEIEGTQAYYDAFTEISDMLAGKKPLNVGRAVFLAENAYYNNQLDYADYQKAIKDKVAFCNLKIQEEKRNQNNNIVKNMMLFRLITDTLKVKPTGTEKTVTSLPVKYDLEDAESKINYDSHFVTKLIRTNEGQCNSMPLYYLILAEEMGAEAYWSFSPRHSFVKIKDEKGRWYNLELTNGCVMSDVHYMNNSYIKAEAIQNRLYLEPLDKKNIVAEMLIEMAYSYYQKFGYDDFALQCADVASKNSDNQLHSLVIKSGYQTQLTLVLAHLLDAKNPEILKQKSPKAYQHFERMQERYNQIDNLGYEELPEDLYKTWLKYIDSQKEKAGKEKSIFINID